MKKRGLEGGNWKLKVGEGRWGEGEGVVVRSGEVGGSSLDLQDGETGGDQGDGERELQKLPEERTLDLHDYYYYDDSRCSPRQQRSERKVTKGKHLEADPSTPYQVTVRTIQQRRRQKVPQQACQGEDLPD